MCGGKGSGGHAVSLAEANSVHNINNHVVPGKHSQESAMTSRAVGVFSSISRSSGYVPQKAAIVAKDSSEYTLACRGQLQGPVSRQGPFADTHCGGGQGRQPGCS